MAWHSHRYDETEEVKAEELDNIVAWTQHMKEEKLRVYDRSDAICLLAVPNDRAFVLLLASCSHRNVNREASWLDSPALAAFLACVADTGEIHQSTANGNVSGPCYQNFCECTVPHP